MGGFSHKISIRSFLTIGPYEEDPEFRELLRNIGRQGLFVYGLLGSGMIIAFVLAHIFTRGATMSWNYTTLVPEQQILMFDKTLILLICLSMVLFSYTSISLKWMRLQVFGLVFIACMASLLDDVASYDVSFNTAYTTIILLFSIAIVPYAGWQTGLISITIIVSTVVLLEFVPVREGMAPLQLKVSQVIYISIIAILLTGMTSQIYINRYRQYRARKRAEELTRKLKDRAQILERLKEKSDHQAKKLRETEKLKDRFFANISHEFRTPLTVILGPLKDMLEGDGEERKTKLGRNMAGLMYRNGQRLLNLINQLLELSKIDAGRIKLERTTLNLNEFVSDAVLEFTPFAESRKVKLACDVPDAPVHLRADPAQMDRVIGNLISNAIKFTPQGGTVTVSVACPEDQEVLVRVRDTGVGIPEDELPYIFDRFYQATHEGERMDTGTGIGLALAKEIVELHGGHLRVESEQGKGTEFTLSLATVTTLTGTDQEAATRSPSQHDFVEEWSSGKSQIPQKNSSGQNGTDRPTILIIDDNPDILTYLYGQLSDRYRLHAKQSSKEALQLLKEERVDLVISDVMMPAPDGFELCRMIKEDPKLNHIPVILLTAQASEESRLEGLEHGADDYISKPFSASELLVRVENLIELRRTLREKYSEQVRLEGNPVEVTSEDARFLKQVQEVIEQEMENSNFSVDWLAGEVNLSARQLQRKIRAITDLSAGGYIRMIRLERARQLLGQQWGNISEVAYKVGFQDAKYFSSLFKQTFGETPSDFMGNQE